MWPPPAVGVVAGDSAAETPLQSVSPSSCCGSGSTFPSFHKDASCITFGVPKLG